MNGACSDLCGGCAAMRIPTANRIDPLQTVALWRGVTRRLSRTPKARGLATSTVFASRGTSFDHSVGAQEHRLRDREAKRRGGLEVYYELERGWLLDG